MASSVDITVNNGIATVEIDVTRGLAGAAADLSSPDPIGDITPNSGAFTTLSATGTATLPHIHGSLAGNLYIHVRNTTGGVLSRGTPIYIVGNVGDTDRVTVAAADNTNAAKMPAVGLLEESLNNNGDGNAIIVGELPAANTNSYSINQELYVGVGAITGTKPTTGEVQSVGAVARVNTNTGVIVVNMQGRRTRDGAFATAAQGALADSAVQPGDLATVATTGAYADLSGKPTLGNSAALNVGTTAGTVAAGDDARLSDARTPLSHTHGNISNDGKIGSTENLPIITTTSGVLTTGSFGTTANTFTQGNDSRLSDERVPTSAGLTTKFGTAKTTPVDADKVAILDSAASDAPKHSTLTAIWTWIQSKFAGASSKTTPIDADSFNIVDSADSNAAKRVTGTNLKAYLKTYLDTLYVALTGNQTVAGNKTFSGQTELTGQAATNSTSAMTRGLVESAKKLRTNEKIYGCYSVTASGGGSSAGANTYGLGFAQLIAGTATSSYAFGYYALEPTNNGFGSGVGTNFGANWEVSGSFRHSASDNHEGIFRLGIAVLTNSTNLANANAFSSIGVGFEFGRVSTNINQARIIYHDGSTYKTSAWVTVYTGDPVQREFAYRLHNNGSGTVTLYMTNAGSNNIGSPSMVNINSLVSITDGPTGTSATSSGIYWSAVNSSATYTVSLGRLSPSPILMTFN